MDYVPGTRFCHKPSIWRTFFIISIASISLLAGHGLAQAGCEDAIAATLKLESEARPVVEVRLNGSPRFFLVDTGSDVTSVTPETALSLHLPIDQLKSSRLVAVDGSEVRSNNRLADLDLGGVKLTKLSVSTMSIRADAATHTLSGVLGANILSGFDVDLDIPGGSVSLHQRRGCSGARPPWSEASHSINIVVTKRGRVLMPVRIDGHPVTGMFDTGADRIFVPYRTVSACGEAPILLDAAARTIGTSGGAGSIALSPGSLSRVSIGEEAFQDLPVMAGNFGPSVADLLIGATYMRGRRFFISYSTHTLYVEAARKATEFRPSVLASGNENVSTLRRVADLVR